MNKQAITPRMLQGTLDAAEIAASVIDKAENRRGTHRTPFVLGIPFTRSSRETAKSRERPSALKIASAM